MMTEILILIAIVLLFFVLLQFAKTTEAASVLNGDAGDYEKSGKNNALLMFLTYLLGMVGVFLTFDILDEKLLPEAASIHGIKLDRLFNWTTIIIMVVFTITQTLLFVFVFRYRHQKGRVASFIAHNSMLEAVWTIVPAIVMTTLVIWGMVVWFDIFDSDLPEDRLVVEVTAKQFGWMPRYAGRDGKFGERVNVQKYPMNYVKSVISPTNELGILWNDKASHDDIMPGEIHLIKNVPTQVRLGALDVLHSFYLPHFRVKMDCVPGVPTSFNFTPTMSTKEAKAKYGEDFKYELACAEMCGRSHFAMPMDVIVHDSRGEFAVWQASQKPIYDILGKPEPSTVSSKFEAKKINSSHH